MFEPIAALGRYSIATLREIGRVAIFAIVGLKSCFVPPFYWREIWRQLVEIGFYCLPIVGLTAIFAGAVLALQTYVGCERWNAESAVASVVAVGLTRVLGPVFAGLMVAGRMSSSIAAEIGSMKVSEQIDALKILRVDPFKFLVAPRVFAGTITLPFLAFVADVVGIMGGFLVAVLVLNFPSGSYIEQTINALRIDDMICGLVQATSFGFVLTTLGCYHGYDSDLGARGVGNATTSAVVSSCIMILILTYMLSALFFGI